jgi:orotate phosphoribosyltransferase-like protein
LRSLGLRDRALFKEPMANELNVNMICVYYLREQEKTRVVVTTADAVTCAFRPRLLLEWRTACVRYQCVGMPAAGRAFPVGLIYGIKQAVKLKCEYCLP